MTSSPTLIGLTGGIACGKSVVEERLRTKWGLPVLDTDALGHEVLRSGSPVLPELLEAFGSDVLDAEGHVDRKRLGRIVFADESQRQKLNAIVHPVIRRKWQAWCSERTEPLSVVSIPLLFECGYQTHFDGVLCIWAPEPLMIQRLQTRGLDEVEARRRIQSQWPVDRKAAQSTWVLKNDLTLDHLYKQVDRWVPQNSPEKL